MYEAEIKNNYAPVIISGQRTTLSAYVDEKLQQQKVIIIQQREKEAQVSVKKSKGLFALAIGGLIAGVQVALFFVQNQTRTPIRIYVEIGLFGALAVIFAIVYAYKADKIRNSR